MSLRGRKNADHVASPADLPVQPIYPVRRGDFLLVNLGKRIERERVLKPFFQASDRLGEPLLVVLDQSGSRTVSALFIGLKPELLQMATKRLFSR